MEYEDRREILTPEGVQLALPLAHLGSRFVAIVIDLAIGAAALTLTVYAINAAFGGLAARIALAAGLLVFYIGYQVVFEVFGWRPKPRQAQAGPARGHRRRDRGRPAREPDPQLPAADRGPDALLPPGGRSACWRRVTTSASATSPRARSSSATHTRERSRRRRCRRSSPRATRPGTSAASGRSRRAPCAPSSSAAPSCARKPVTRSPSSSRSNCARRVAGARPGLDDETVPRALRRGQGPNKRPVIRRPAGRGVGPSVRLTDSPRLAPMEPISCPLVAPAHSNRFVVSIACA